MSGRLDPRARPFYPPSNQSALRLSHPNCPLKPTIENKHNDLDNHTQLSSPAASPTPRPTPISLNHHFNPHHHVSRTRPPDIFMRHSHSKSYNPKDSDLVSNISSSSLSLIVDSCNSATSVSSSNSSSESGNGDSSSSNRGGSSRNSRDSSIRRGNGSRSRGQSHDGLNPLIFHRFKAIPTPRIVSYNVDSYSSRGTSRASLYRRGRFVQNMDALAANSDVIMTQESKTEKSSVIYRHLLKPRWEPFKNPNPDNNLKGGTDIFVSHSFLSTFTPEHIILIPGYLHAIHLLPKDDDSLFIAGFTIINVYLPSGSDSVTKARRLSILKKLAYFKTREFVFAGGDWNLTMHESDSSGGDHFASSTEQRDALRHALIELRLEEVFQPLHTCVRGGKAPSSSRIDRVYISHSLADKCTMSPRTDLPSHPYPPGGREGSKGPSDHFPIRLSFKPPGLTKGTRYKIPEWIASHPIYHKRVRKKWAEARKPKKPGKAWLLFKRLADLEAKAMMRENRESATSKAGALTVAISLYKGIREGSLNRVEAEKLAKKHGTLYQAYVKDAGHRSGSRSEAGQHIYRKPADNTFPRPDNLREKPSPSPSPHVY